MVGTSTVPRGQLARPGRAASPRASIARTSRRGARRRARARDRLVVELARTDEPVERVLQRPRDAVRVLGTREQQPVGLQHPRRANRRLPAARRRRSRSGSKCGSAPTDGNSATSTSRVRRRASSRRPRFDDRACRLPLITEHRDHRRVQPRSPSTGFRRRAHSTSLRWSTLPSTSDTKPTASIRLRCASRPIASSRLGFGSRIAYQRCRAHGTPPRGGTVAGG